MNSSDEFTSPIATSTIWKKKKPSDWNQESETTFQAQKENQGEELALMEAKEEAFEHDQDTNCESTLNFWKYLVPANPSELEEDSFIDVQIKAGSDEEVVTTSATHCIESFPEQVAEEIAKLDITGSASDEDDTRSPVEDDFDISPIPGYIITEHSVLIRKPSSSSYHGKRHVPDVCDTRKVLSAPASLVLAGGDVVPNSSHFDSIHSDVQSYPLDIDENGEDLINESFSNYLDENLPEVSTLATVQKSESVKSNQSIEEEINEALHAESSARQSLSSSNTVPFIDPDASMTTEALENVTTPCISTSFVIPQPVEGYDDTQGEFGEEELSDEADDLATTPKSNRMQSDSREASPMVQLVPSEHNSDAEVHQDSTTPDGASAGDRSSHDSEDLVHDTTPQNLRKHPSFNSPEVHNHSIVDRILKEECNITVPPNFIIEDGCAVGITRKFFLPLRNKTDMWIKCSVSVDDVGWKIGYKVPKNSLIIPPLGDENLPFSLCATQDGLCLGSIELIANSVISGMIDEQYHSCKVQAIAKLPNLQLAPTQIDFGIQTENKESSFELRNKSDYELPLKIVLKSDGMDEVYSLSDPVSKYRTAVFAVVLQPRQVFFGHLEFCPYEQYTLCQALLQVYVDSPNGAMLAETSVTGTVGFYKLRIPSDKHALSFQSTPGEPTSTNIKLLNTGNLETSVTLGISRPFAVTPTFIPSLVPGEEISCEVSYFPVVTEYVTGRLTLSLTNDTVVYQVPTEGRSTKNKTRGPSSGPIAYSLLANKSIVNFGGTELGSQKEETLLLQNDSPTQLMCLVLRVISPSRSFYILQYSDILLSVDIVLAAGSSQSVTLGYTPMHVEQHMGELIVKTKSNDVSFPIPLTGHGGISQVSVLNAEQSSSRLWVDMGRLAPHARSSSCITLHNSGPRGAFVSATLETEEGYLVPSSTAWVNPSSVVVPAGSTRDVYVIYEAGVVEQSEDLRRLALLKLYCGDEVARKRFCKVMKLLKSSLEDQDLPFDPTLEFLVPDGNFGEADVKVPHISKNDMLFERRLFGTGLYQLFISVMGRTGIDPPEQRQTLLPLTQQEVVTRDRMVSANTSGKSLTPTNNSNRGSNQLAVDKGDSPENIKPYNISPVASNNKNTSQNGERGRSSQRTAKHQIWSFTVDELKFNKACVFHVVNEENEPLVYEVSYEGQLFTLAPTAGVIPAYGCTEISIRPLSLSRPYVSTLLVTAGGQEQTLKVTYTPPSRPQISPAAATHSDARDGSKVVLAHDKVLLFSTIPLNTSSSNFFEFTNTHSVVIHWNLCSVAPAYRKVDTQEPIRVPYSAFCVSVMSGVTPAGAKEKIPLTFYPKHVGLFTQLWEFTFYTAPLKSLKHKRRIVLEGSATLSRVSNTSHDASGSSRPRDRIFLKTEKLGFSCSITDKQSLSFKLGNPLKTASNVKLSSLRAPFYLKYKEVLVEAGHSARIPVKFVPTLPGSYSDTLLLDTEQGMLQLEIVGEAHN